MQRIPIPGGRITPRQLQTVADLAILYTASTPLHLTTRQSIELHNVPEADASAVLEELHEAGLPTLGAGGDNVRTITVCPCCASNPDAYDIAPLAEAVSRFIAERRPQYALPRKFKMTFYGCKRPESRPFVNCLAFGATSESTLRVIGAGSMGSRPEPGIVLRENLPIHNVFAFIEAAIAMFDKYGDRQDRRKARFRHIRQCIGDEAFRIILEDFFRQHKTNPAPLDLTLARGAGSLHKRSLQTIAGELQPASAQLIAQTASQAEARIQINLHHGIDLYSKQPLQVPPQLASMLNRPRIVACPGCTTCKNGIVNCMETAAQLSDVLKDNPAVQGKTIALSGCPNNCAQSHIADIGLMGRLKTVEGKQYEAYQVLFGGDSARSAQLAEPVEVVLADELPTRISALLSSLGSNENDRPA